MSAAEAFGTVLARYGQSVSVHRDGQAEGTACRAFVQPILERTEAQECPTVLGTVCTDRWLYLGDPAVSLEDLGSGYVRWGTRKLEVLRAQPIYVGAELSHWWAVLKLREEEAEA